MWLSEIGGAASDVLTLYVIITPFDLEDVRYSLRIKCLEYAIIRGFSYSCS
jgi:hypothetical protein